MNKLFGAMKGEDIQSILDKRQKAKIDILPKTTVIEYVRPILMNTN
jgi:hypothetical protein